MATKKTIIPPPQLVKDKEELKTLIQGRIRQGEAMLSMPVSTLDEKAIRWEAFMRWDELNHEIIASAFDQRQHVHEYEYHEGFDIQAAFGGRREKNLAELIEEERGAITYQLKKLQSFYDKIDLQHIAHGIQRSAPAQKRDDLAIVLHLLNRFHKVAQKLRDQRAGRSTLQITDEYDVQYLLVSLLQVDFDDVRKEDYSPSHAGANSRIDIVLKQVGIIIETKMTSDQLTDRKLGEELLIDIGRYKEYPDARHLVMFIYDKGDHVSNKAGLIRNLEKQSTASLSVHVVINPY